MLQAPSTVRFVEATKLRDYEDDADYYRITFDAENVFGTPIRSTMNCELRDGFAYVADPQHLTPESMRPLSPQSREEVLRGVDELLHR